MNYCWSDKKINAIMQNFLDMAFKPLIDFINDQFSMEMILKCLDKSVNTLNPNFKYFDSILERWHERGFKTVEDLKNDIKPETKRKKPVNSSAGSKNKFHNFDQKIKDYSEEELEKIAKKRLEKKLNKLGLSEEGDDKN